MKKIVKYIRVSTVMQDEKGNSFQIQHAAIDAFLKNKYQQYEVIAIFEEVQTGTGKKARIEIYKAIELCKREGAVLVSSKMDRLGRNVDFLRHLIKTGIEYIACDFLDLGTPELNKLMQTILMAFAEYEANQIRTRVKAGIAHAIKNGKQWGQKSLSDHKGYLASAASRSSKAIINENNRKALDCIKGKRAEGLTFAEIADHLNKENYKTSREKAFSKDTVQQLFTKREAFI